MKQASRPLLVTQEAMAAGLPLMVTDVGAIGEDLFPDRTGRLVPPNAPRAQADATGALQEVVTRRAMGHEARRPADERVDSVVCARRILDHIRELVEMHPREAVRTR